MTRLHQWTKRPANGKNQPPYTVRGDEFLVRTTAQGASELGVYYVVLPMNNCHICRKDWSDCRCEHNRPYLDKTPQSLYDEAIEVLETIENDTKLVPNWLWVRIQSIVKRARKAQLGNDAPLMHPWERNKN
jgi:hypothetical protein